MFYNTLGQTDIKVSDFCLGTMTWGTQTPEAEGHRQIDTALDHGINILDTAEMYPVNPVAAETVGETEKVIGTWVEKSGRRGEMMIATKVTGANGGFCRDGEEISSDSISRALDASLKRLRTDYIDLYQLHWPNRGSYAFRQNWTYDPSGHNRAETLAHMDDTLGELQKQIDAGKIRHVGLSNESAWGTVNWLHRAEAMGGPRMQAVQNEYSLLHRQFDTDMAEVSANEQVGLLAYSPLGTGLLTGKYQNGACPKGSRMEKAGSLHGRQTNRAFEAVDTYLDLARNYSMDPSHLAMAFCRARPFMTSVIFGATTQEQLEHILKASDLTLTEELLEDINTANRAQPFPY